MWTNESTHTQKIDINDIYIVDSYGKIITLISYGRFTTFVGGELG